MAVCICKSSSPEVVISGDFPAGIDIGWNYARQAAASVDNWVSTVNGTAQTNFMLLDETNASNAFGGGQLIYDNGSKELTVHFSYNSVQGFGVLGARRGYAHELTPPGCSVAGSREHQD